MQIALDKGLNVTNLIRSYEPGNIRVNDKNYQTSLIVPVTEELKLWEPLSFAELQVEHLQLLAQFKPQIILLGTGSKIYFPYPEMRLALQNLGCCIEFMDTAAACRTYNVLASENRSVLAALLLR